MAHHNEDFSKVCSKGPPLNELGVRIPDVNRIRDADGCLVVWIFNHYGSRVSPTWGPPSDRDLLEYSPR